MEWTPLKSYAKGFTLIEIMIVMAIMGAVIALSMPYMSNRNSQTKRFLREFTVLTREIHTRAKLNGSVYRLVIDLQGVDPNVPKSQSYWVEKANGTTVMRADEESMAMERARETDPEKKSDPKGFEIDKQILRSVREMPSGLTFDKVELARTKTPITSGRAFVHFMPQGLVDEAAIHIKGEKQQAWTISVHPLTGKSEIISKPISLQEIKSQ